MNAQATAKLLSPKFLTQTNPPPSISEDKLSKLNSIATTHLQDIVAGFKSGKKAFKGINAGEINAAKELLAEDGESVG